MQNYNPIIQKLLNSAEPAIRWKIRTLVLAEDPSSSSIKSLQSEIKNSPLVQKMLSNRDESGKILTKHSVYDKWQGAHWILATLADIGYPANDAELLPVKDQILDCWLTEFYFKDFPVESKKKCYNYDGVPLMQGRLRRCASQQGNALYMLFKLGLQDERLDKLVERLLYWQWPDGGWNCDRNPEAINSSFMETLLPLRGLSLYAQINSDKKAADAVVRAAEVFLKRHLFLKLATGTIIHPEFTFLHYPLYWHYDILAGLKVLAEAGFVKDARCHAALDLLESKFIAGEGWAAEKKYYTAADQIKLGADYINWGGTAKKKMNPWVTADALFVLKAAGRIE